MKTYYVVYKGEYEDRSIELITEDKEYAEAYVLYATPVYIDQDCPEDIYTITAYTNRTEEEHPEYVDMIKRKASMQELVYDICFELPKNESITLDNVHNFVPDMYEIIDYYMISRRKDRPNTVYNKEANRMHIYMTELPKDSDEYYKEIFQRIASIAIQKED